jgi:uncharacterized protein YcfJ
MTQTFQALIGITTLAFGCHAAAQVTLHEDEDFQGRTLSSQQRAPNLQGNGFNDRTSSVVVVGRRWEVCDEARFSGYCRVLRPGQYPTLTAIGLNDRISSARPLADNENVADGDYAPMPLVVQDFRRGRNERMYEATVTASRAVAGTPAQRCWIERQDVVQQQTEQQTSSDLNVPGAAVGAIIGGILGHQVGGGTGKQLATVGGAIGGAALGAQYGRNERQAQAAPVTQDVRRCDGNAPQAVPGHWDVTYMHAGVEHHVQMANPPGRTIVVNRQGEPRV